VADPRPQTPGEALLIVVWVKLGLTAHAGRLPSAAPFSTSWEAGCEMCEAIPTPNKSSLKNSAFDFKEMSHSVSVLS
jgi:hypothetical protein